MLHDGGNPKLKRGVETVSGIRMVSSHTLRQKFYKTRTNFQNRIHNRYSLPSGC